MKKLKLILINLFFITLNAYNFEQNNILNLQNYLNLPQKTTDDLLNICDQNNTLILKEPLFRSTKLPFLFKNYPELKNKISYIELGNWPTPVYKLENFSKRFNINLYIKRDDLSGKIKSNKQLFSGNKLRKLEFLLADAINKKFETVLTFGCAGSNHAIATAVYAKELELKSVLMLKPQHNSKVAKRNLLFGLDSCAKLIYCPTSNLRACATVFEVFNSKQKTGKMPYIIPTGGSCPIGVLGYINGIFELKDQIDQNIIPMPDKIYVPLGSSGTITGILLGLKALKLNIKIIGITTEPEESENEFFYTITKLFNQTNKLLHDYDNSFEIFKLNPDDFEINKNFSGKDYALFTQEGINAIKVLKEIEIIDLDGVYSGKAFSGLLCDIEKKNIKPTEIVLFWNTFYSGSPNDNLDYRNLPIEFHKYFEENVQELDR